MPNLDDAKSEALYCMFKGEPGTRKSTAALSFPKPIYYFDVDQKISSLMIPAKKWNIASSDIEYDRHKDWNSMEMKLEQLELNCKYKTIVIDSITSVGDLINRQTRRLKSGTTGKDGGEKGIRIGGITVNSLEDYKAENAAFDSVVSKTKSIWEFHKVNIILVAHVIGERAQKDRAGSTHFARIIITGGKAISGKIPAYCPEVYHFNVEPAPIVTDPPEFGLFTVHTGDDFARTSLPLDPKIIFNERSLYDDYLKPAMDKR